MHDARSLPKSSKRCEGSRACLEDALLELFAGLRRRDDTLHIPGKSSTTAAAAEAEAAEATAAEAAAAAARVTSLTPPPLPQPPNPWQPSFSSIVTTNNKFQTKSNLLACNILALALDVVTSCALFFLFLLLVLRSTISGRPTSAL